MLGKRTCRLPPASGCSRWKGNQKPIEPALKNGRVYDPVCVCGSVCVLVCLRGSRPNANVLYKEIEIEHEMNIAEWACRAVKTGLVSAAQPRLWPLPLLSALISIKLVANEPLCNAVEYSTNALARLHGSSACRMSPKDMPALGINRAPLSFLKPQNLVTITWQIL